MYKQEVMNFSLLKKLINLVRFAELVNLISLAQSSYIKACQPHQLCPGKSCQMIMLFVFIYITNTVGFNNIYIILNLLSIAKLANCSKLND